MSKEQLLKGSPAVVWAALLLFLAVLAAFVLLILAGKPTSEISGLLDWAYKAVTGAAALGALGYGASAARSAHAAERQTNGPLDQRMEDAATRAIVRALDGEIVEPQAVPLRPAYPVADPER